MRILYVINTLGTGGTERSMAELMEPLSRLGVDPAVAILQSDSTGVEQAVRSQGIPVEVLGTHFWRALPSLRASLSRLRPSLVHTALFESDIVGRLAARGMGVPVITSLVNTGYEPERLADPNVKRWRLQGARLGAVCWTASAMIPVWIARWKVVPIIMPNWRLKPGSIWIPWCDTSGSTTIKVRAGTLRLLSRH